MSMFRKGPGSRDCVEPLAREDCELSFLEKVRCGSKGSDQKLQGSCGHVDDFEVSRGFVNTFGKNETERGGDDWFLAQQNFGWQGEMRKYVRRGSEQQNTMYIQYAHQDGLPLARRKHFFQNHGPCCAR